MDTEYFTQHIQCSRDDKEECLYMVRLLVELAVVAQNEGLLALDRLMEDKPERYAAPFLRKAVQLVVDIGNPGKIRRVLNNCILSSNYVGRQFLSNIVIMEAMLAIHQQEDLDYIFRFLVPSYFGMDFESRVVAVYDSFRATHRRS